MNLCDYNEITALLQRHGFRFSKSLGQNFLINPRIPERIAEESLANDQCGVLEVGPGVGCLTSELAKNAAKVLSLELDSDLKPVLAETLQAYSNVSIEFCDALKADLPTLCKQYFGELPIRVCANLPYNVATPLITEFLQSGLFKSITVMIQKEVAGRICASAGSGDYGAFSVLCQWYAETEKLFDVGPECFLPRPKVTSSVIRLTPRQQKPAEVYNEEFFFKTVRGAFAQRRKTLLNSLSSYFSEYSKEQLENAICQSGLSPQVRGEALNLQQFSILSNRIWEVSHHVQ